MKVKIITTQVAAPTDVQNNAPVNADSASTCAEKGINSTEDVSGLNSAARSVSARKKRTIYTSFIDGHPVWENPQIYFGSQFSCVRE